MLEKLLSLLLHAKSGAVATVLVLGASGALVTATVDNGMTTITITQPSQSSGATTGSNTTTTNTTVDQAILALFTRTSAEHDPSAPATGKGCSDEAHETNALVRDVNDTYKTDHQAVVALHKDARTAEDRDDVKEADKELKAIRQAAVKFFHEAFDCDHEDEGDNGSTSTDTTVAFSGDPKLVAEMAIAAMNKVVEDLKKALEDVEATTPTSQNTHKPDNDKHDNKGKGHGRGGRD